MLLTPSACLLYSIDQVIVLLFPDCSTETSTTMNQGSLWKIQPDIMNCNLKKYKQKEKRGNENREERNISVWYLFS